MPRFFFDLAGAAADDQGVDLPDVDAARAEAVSFLGAYLADHPDFARQDHWSVEVVDARRKVLMSVRVVVEEHLPQRQP